MMVMVVMDMDLVRVNHDGNVVHDHEDEGG